MSTSRHAALFLACQALLLTACQGPQPRDRSVKPGINESFLDADLDVDRMAKRFEVESREVYARRFKITRPARVGARDGARRHRRRDRAVRRPVRQGRRSRWSGLRSRHRPPLHRAPTTAGECQGPDAVETVLCTERSIELPPNSIDVAFICDTYHHFEYPRSTMAWIHRALRDRGEIVLVDFERIPGVSRDWILGHVRAGKAEVTGELESFGFALVEEVDIPGLEENYLLRFRKR